MRMLLALFVVASAFAQTAQPPEKCIFAGAVADAVTGQLLPRARVSLQSKTPGKGTYLTTTDAAGAFRFEALEAGDYSVTAGESEHSGGGVLSLKSGRQVSVLRFAAGQSITDAVIRLSPLAVLSGHVTDTDGEPIPGAQVGLIGERWMAGIQAHYLFNLTVADDRGEYRFSVSAGRYFLSAGTRGNDAMPMVFSEGPGKPEMRFATVLYPNAADFGGAAAIDARPGQQYTADFRLPMVVTHHVRGAVRPWGLWVGPRVLQLTSETNILGDSLALDKDGRFDQAGVVPGSYLLQALAFEEMGTRLPVDVNDRDVEAILNVVTRGDVKGHVRFDDDGQHDFSKVHIRIRQTNTNHPLGTLILEVQADGSFKIDNAPAGVLQLEVDPQSGCFLQSATFNQRDLEAGRLDLTGGGGGELDMVLGSGTGTVTGSVQGDALVAIIASANGVTGNTGARAAPIDQNGRFQFSFVAPGKYYVWATLRFDAEHWQNMDYVTQMEDGGTAVEVSKKATVQVEIPKVLE